MSKASSNATKRVTIKDVAHAAGVSVTTVSNVLNGRLESMTVETLERVQATIRLLNYHPSSVARSMVTNLTATIGLIINEIDTPLFLQALKYIEPIARSANHTILLCTAHNLDDERHAVDLLLEKDVDGIIFLSTSVFLEDDFLADLAAFGPPIVLVNRTTTSRDFDQILFGNQNGVVGLVDYLVGLGHTHIAHLIGPNNRQSSPDRLAGYRQGLAKHSLPYRADYVQSGDYDLPPTMWAASTRALLALQPRPTAIIAANDIVAATIQRTVQQVGLRVPQDISIIGIDDQPFCTYLNPALTTMLMPVIEAGRQAIELLLGRVSGQRTDIARVTLPCPLIERESSGPAPQDGVT